MSQLRKKVTGILEAIEQFCDSKAISFDGINNVDVALAMVIYELVQMRIEQGKLYQTLMKVLGAINK